MGSGKVYLNSIQAAVPPYEGHSAFAKLLPRLVLPSDRERLEKIIDRLPIEKRYTVLSNPIDPDGTNTGAFYRAGKFPGTLERMKIYQEQALPLASLALEGLFAEIPPDKITHLIITTCTGFYAPGLDIDIMRKFRMKPSVERSLIGYMGCYAACPALKLAHHIARSSPEAKILVLNLELCTLHWREQVPFDQLVSFLLFGDGCAASLVSQEPRGIYLEGFYSTYMEDTLDYMGWTIANDGFYMNLDPGIPQKLMEAIQAHRHAILQGRDREEFRLWAIHPGGRSILDVVQYEMKIEPEAMAPSREVFRDFGNMSSPTVMFVLKKILDNPSASGWGCAMAFGPGLSLESFVFHKEAAA